MEIIEGLAAAIVGMVQIGLALLAAIVLVCFLSELIRGRKST